MAGPHRHAWLLIMDAGHQNSGLCPSVPSTLPSKAAPQLHTGKNQNMAGLPLFWGLAALHCPQEPGQADQGPLNCLPVLGQFLPV